MKGNIQIKAQLSKDNHKFHLTCQIKSIAGVSWPAVVRKILRLSSDWVRKHSGVDQ